MKLIFCDNCGDIVKLVPLTKRYCICHLAWGQYIEPEDENGNYAHAEYGGRAIIFGLPNLQFLLASKSDYVEFFVGWFYKPTGDISMEHIHKEVPDES